MFNSKEDKELADAIGNICDFCEDLHRKNQGEIYGIIPYGVWVKLTGRTDITHEEWVVAKKSGLLKQV
jgi:hypothetical protein